MDDEAVRHVAAHLLARGADANAGEQAGQSALALACGAGDAALAALLLAHGATAARPALLAAAGRGSVEVMEMLLDRAGGGGADVNAHPYDRSTLPLDARDEGWGSALHCAVRGGHADAVRFLLARGADRAYRNKAGVTPLDLARKLGRGEIVTLLESP